MRMISVLMPVYIKERPEYFNLALESIYNQTITEYELIVVADGPLTKNLDLMIKKWTQAFGERMKLVRLASNVGIAKALNAGLSHCSSKYVARMDSDDFCEPERFETQLLFLRDHPEIDVLGSDVSEFIQDYNIILPQKKVVPSIHEDIVRTIWFRNPINHPSVIFNKQKVLDVGGYKDDDDLLWAELYVAGNKFHNINQCLVRMRVGDGLFKRRGLKILPFDIRVRTFLYKNKKINIIKLIIAVSVFTTLRLMPSKIRSILHIVSNKDIV
jgi:glycosyltransferase involved in cell wall biosynthesis